MLHALGWACWKTYVGQPEAEWSRREVISTLGSGLYDADNFEDALSVKEAELSMERRLGASEYAILVVQGNLASTYSTLGRDDQSLRMRRDVYVGTLRIMGEEHKNTLISANNYAASLLKGERFVEAKALLRKMIPVARRVLGKGNDLTLKIRSSYTRALYWNDGATLGDLREAVATLEDTMRTARRVLGSVHPLTMTIERELRNSRAVLSARKTPSAPSREDELGVPGDV